MTRQPYLKSMLTAGLWVSGGVLLGRLMGFFREIAIASRFGTSADADVILFSLTLPDFLVNILIGGALAAALIPQFKRSSPQEMNTLFWEASALIAVFFVALTLLLISQVETVVQLFAPGFTGWTFTASQGMLKVVLWLMPLTALAGITTGYLQSKGHFAVPAMGTLIFNLTLVAAILFFVTGPEQKMFFAGAMILGGILRWASQLLCLPTHGLFQGTVNRWLVNRALITRYAQALAAGSLLMLLPVIARALASLQGPGEFSSLNYATKLVELPMGVCLGVFSAVLLPKLSECFAENRIEEGSRLSQNGVLLIIIISYALILGFTWFGEDLTRLVFGWGSMTPEAIQRIAVLVSIGMLALPAQGTVALIAATANAKQDTNLPLISSLVGLAVFLPFAWFAVFQAGLKGIILSLVVTYWTVMIVQMCLLANRHDIRIIDSEFSRDTTRVAVIGLISFAPFALASTLLKTGLVGNLVLVTLGTGCTLFASLYCIPRIREFVLNRLQSRPPA